MPLDFNAPPPQANDKPALPVARTPVSGNLRGIITCHTPASCWVHWAAGKTQPCTAPDCPHCRQNLPRRWRLYVSIYIPTNKRHLILELPDEPGRTILNHLAEHKSLRHTILAAYRLKPRPNGRVACHLEAGDPDRYKIPQPPDIPACLCTLWKLPQNGQPQEPQT